MKKFEVTKQGITFGSLHPMRFNMKKCKTKDCKTRMSDGHGEPDYCPKCQEPYPEAACAAKVQQMVGAIAASQRNWKEHLAQHTWSKGVGEIVQPVPKDSTNPKDLIGMTKPPLDLVPPALIIHVSQAMKNGAVKFGPYNWRANRVRISVYIAAALRHILALQDGEDVAADSKVHHAAHAAACLGIILDALETGNLVDDRPIKGAAAKLIDRFTVKNHVSHMDLSDNSR